MGGIDGSIREISVWGPLPLSFSKKGGGYVTGQTTPVALIVLFAAAALLLAGCVKEVKLTAGGEKVEFVETRRLSGTN